MEALSRNTSSGLLAKMGKSLRIFSIIKGIVFILPVALSCWIIYRLFLLMSSFVPQSWIEIILRQLEINEDYFNLIHIIGSFILTDLKKPNDLKVLTDFDSKILLITISLTIGYYYIHSDDNNLILKKDI